LLQNIDQSAGENERRLWQNVSAITARCAAVRRLDSDSGHRCKIVEICADKFRVCTVEYTIFTPSKATLTARKQFRAALAKAAVTRAKHYV
jgi:hypothetical protein